MATRPHHIVHNPDLDLLRRLDITQPIRVQTVRGEPDPRPQQPFLYFIIWPQGGILSSPFRDPAHFIRLSSEFHKEECLALVCRYRKCSGT